jgi:hypothetical protein
MAIEPTALPEKPVRITFTVQARINGHAGPLAIEGETLRDVMRVVRGLSELPQIEVVEPQREWRALPDGTPICPKHNVPMRLREKQGDSWRSHNTAGEGESPCYCKGYAGKDSPGWNR